MKAACEPGSLMFCKFLLQLRTIGITVAVNDVIHGRRMRRRREDAGVGSGNVAAQCFDLVLELLRGVLISSKLFSFV